VATRSVSGNTLEPSAACPPQAAMPSAVPAAIAMFMMLRGKFMKFLRVHLNDMSTTF
jgi:hypothetical protein